MKAIKFVLVLGLLLTILPNYISKIHIIGITFKKHRILMMLWMKKVTMIFMTKIGMKTGMMKSKFKQIKTSRKPNQPRKIGKTNQLNLWVALLSQTTNKELQMRNLQKELQLLIPLKLKMLLEKYMPMEW